MVYGRFYNTFNGPSAGITSDFCILNCRTLFTWFVCLGSTECNFTINALLGGSCGYEDIKHIRKTHLCISIAVCYIELEKQISHI